MRAFGRATLCSCTTDVVEIVYLDRASSARRLGRKRCSAIYRSAMTISMARDLHFGQIRPASRGESGGKYDEGKTEAGDDTVLLSPAGDRPTARQELWSAEEPCYMDTSRCPEFALTCGIRAHLVAAAPCTACWRLGANGRALSILVHWPS